MTLAAALVASRWLHYACLTTLFGVAAFPLYALGGGAEPVAWTRRWRRLGGLCLWGALLSGLGWFLFAAATMSGEAAAMLDPAALKSVLVDTPFGGLWAARLALVLAMLAVLTRPSGRAAGPLAAILSGLLLASLAFTGHAQAEEGAAGAMHVLADAAHLLTAGVWIGGLFALAFLAGRDGAPGEPDLGGVLSNFSGMAYSAVAVLALTGVANSLFVLGGPSALVTTGYGRLLSVKLALFGAMLALAAANRFWISPALGRAQPDRAVWLARLKRHVLGEQILAALVLGAVAELGAIDPAA